MTKYSLLAVAYCVLQSASTSDAFAARFSPDHLSYSNSHVDAADHVNDVSLNYGQTPLSTSKTHVDSADHVNDVSLNYGHTPLNYLNSQIDAADHVNEVSIGSGQNEVGGTTKDKVKDRGNAIAPQGYAEMVKPNEYKGDGMCD